MKILVQVLISMTLLGAATNVFAGPNSKKIQDAANAFFATKTKKKKSFSPFLFAPQVTTFNLLLTQQKPNHDVVCPPSPAPGPSCADAACQRLDNYECDDLDEIKQIGQACRGNYDGSCLSAVCDRLDKYECDDLDEIKQVGQVCSKQFKGDCIDSVCDRMDKYECDDFDEIKSVGAICEGVFNRSCIDSICSKLDKYECDDIDEIKEVAEACKGL